MIFIKLCYVALPQVKGIVERMLHLQAVGL